MIERFLSIRSVAYLTLTVLVSLAPYSHAAGQYYQSLYSSNYNGQITLTDSLGNSTTAISNPTTNISTSQSYVTQPPVVIVQATATLPIHAVGDVCTATTSGTSPSQSAGEGTAITLDRTSLLTCQSGA